MSNQINFVSGMLKNAGSLGVQGSAFEGSQAHQGLQAMGRGLSNAWGGAKQIGNAAVQGVQNAGSAVAQGARNVVGGIADTANDAVQGVQNAGSAVAGKYNSMTTGDKAQAAAGLVAGPLGYQAAGAARGVIQGVKGMLNNAGGSTPYVAPATPQLPNTSGAFPSTSLMGAGVAPGMAAGVAGAGPSTPSAAPAATPAPSAAPAPAGRYPNASSAAPDTAAFQKYHGSSYNPNSAQDRSKMQALQSSKPDASKMKQTANAFPLNKRASAYPGL